MSQNTVALRDGTRRLTKFLAGYNIEVSQVGLKACVVPDKDGKPARITIPYIADGADDAFIRAIHGFIDHEVGHVLATDFKVVKGIDKSLHSIWNIIEDPYVERAYAKTMPGVAANLNTVHGFVLREIIDPQWANVESGEDADKFFTLFVCIIRAWAGQEIFNDYMADKWGAVEKFTDRIKDLAPRVALCGSTADCLNLAKEIQKRFKNIDFSSEDDDKNNKNDGDDNGGALDGIRSLSEMAQDYLSKKASQCFEEAEYKIFTTDDDYIGPPEITEYALAVSRQMSTIQKMDGEVGRIIGVMCKDLERLMVARSRTIKTGGHRSGKLHGSNVWRSVLNDDRVYSRKTHGRSHDVAVSLLIDHSGSMMQRRKYELATLAGYALAVTMNKLGIRYEALGFTTDTIKSSTYKMIKAQAEKNEYARFGPLYITVYKEFNEHLSLAVKERFAFCYNRLHRSRSNVDGESLEIAAHRLLKQPCERRILFVLSDGLPFSDGNTQSLQKHLKTVAEELEQIQNFDLYAIGINSREVQRFYKNNEVITDITQLPKVVINHLKSHLLK